MSRTVRATDARADIRKADNRRRRVIRAQKYGTYFGPEFGDTWPYVIGATDNMPRVSLAKVTDRK